jgi:hypothetical protein
MNEVQDNKIASRSLHVSGMKQVELVSLEHVDLEYAGHVIWHVTMTAILRRP